jgi:antitoxin component YwqK of YwqJK toxin-antitoxin module
MKNGEGNGKEYDFDGNLIYEGEYLNGVKNGKGKEYLNGEIKYEGEYLNGVRNGKGKEFKYNRLIFEGEYLNGKRNGKGKEYYDLEELYLLKKIKY